LLQRAAILGREFKPAVPGVHKRLGRRRFFVGRVRTGGALAGWGVADGEFGAQLGEHGVHASCVGRRRPGPWGEIVLEHRLAEVPQRVERSVEVAAQLRIRPCQGLKVGCPEVHPKYRHPSGLVFPQDRRELVVADVGGSAMLRPHQHDERPGVLDPLLYLRVKFLARLQVVIPSETPAGQIAEPLPEHLEELAFLFVWADLIAEVAHAIASEDGSLGLRFRRHGYRHYPSIRETSRNQRSNFG
jgi:hypothetical protein